MKPLVDTHCHLDHKKFEGELDAILHRARAAGVWRFVSIGCAQGPGETWPALELARKHEDIVSTAGVHPHDAASFETLDLKCVEDVALDPSVVAIGEMGLDYFYDHSPREQQAEIFRRQIAIARSAGKPIVVHTRNAAEDTLRILKEEHARDVGGIIHCFSEDLTFARAALEMGFVASFSGIVTFRSATAIAEAARHQPADAILVETDAPYLAPLPYRGQRNEPAYVARTLEFVAELRGEDPDALRETTTANACRIFGLPHPPS